jgi:hypothetical protein
VLGPGNRSEWRGHISGKISECGDECAGFDVPNIDVGVMVYRDLILSPEDLLKRGRGVFLVKGILQDAYFLPGCKFLNGNTIDPKGRYG